jgi:hypothetical protein
MTGAQNPSRAEPISEPAPDTAIVQAAKFYDAYVLPSLQAKAAAALADVRAVLADRHDVTGADTTFYGEDALTGRILDVVVRSAQRASLTQPIDPIELLGVVVRATAERLGMPLVPVEGPTGDNPAHGYVVLPRQPETPPWGPSGDAPLLIKLSRYDNGRGSLGPWQWEMAPDVPGGTVDGREVVGPPPSPDVATEVGKLAAGTLTGAVSPRRR